MGRLDAERMPSMAASTSSSALMVSIRMKSAPAFGQSGGLPRKCRAGILRRQEAKGRHDLTGWADVARDQHLVIGSVGHLAASSAPARLNSWT